MRGHIRRARSRSPLPAPVTVLRTDWVPGYPPVHDTGATRWDVAVVCRAVRGGPGGIRRGVGYLRASAEDLTAAARELMEGAALRGVAVREVYTDAPDQVRTPGCSALLATIRAQRPAVLAVPRVDMLAWPVWGDGPATAQALHRMLGLDVVDLSHDPDQDRPRHG